MNLSEVILNCFEYEDSDDFTHQVFAEKVNGRFEPDSPAIILKLSSEEMEMGFTEVAKLKCPGYDYFLDVFIIQDFYNDLKDLKEFKNQKDLVKRMIYYAEFDA